MKTANGFPALLASTIADKKFSLRFPEVNCLRGVAILAVVFTHLTNETYGSYVPLFPVGWFAELSGKTALFPLGSFFSNGRVGVNLFFVLSGFVLYLPYTLQIRKMESLSDGFKFYKQRALRLLPLFLINAVVGGVWYYCVFPKHPSFLIKEWLLVVSCCSAFYNFQPVFSFVLWTLVIEIWFSILFVPLCFLIQRYGLARITVLVYIVALATRSIGPQICQVPVDSYFNPISDSIFGRLDDFLVGMVVAGIYAKRQSLNFSSRAGCGFVLLGILLVWTGMVLWDATLYLKISGRFEAFYNILYNTGFGVLLWGCICLRSSGKGQAAAFLQNYPLQLMGMMCYSIYIWHGLMMEFTEYQENWVSFWRYIIFTLIVSGVSYRYIEFARTRNWRDLLPKKYSPA
jgi:peptidoglycan/LPS O-acetylase OafA/YrhL